ncbi:MAG: saccharopine dehydrogenase NADP-binding domain-containing protein, partial [Candidatus Cloacimonetes bacterium]|nr:saccharopine dehydrogenase NADP-binding domain-containing protein [Candidatus Cloacimonadota bacterium]
MRRKVTIFGAGLVVKPMVDYLAGHGFEIVVASRTLSKAEKLAAPHANVKALQVLSTDLEKMEELVKASDLCVSLLPATLHVSVARLCLKHRKHMVTTSYISPEMRSLDSAAREAGVMILNEIGVDPGIDHMSAMKIFHQVEAEGGKIVSFMSYCGGLPAPEANTNPLGYKFSWAPRGVLKAAGNGARYMLDGKIVEIAGEDLFRNYWLVDVEGAGTLEAYPNRDSLGYIDLYGLQHLKTMYRGTFRNISHCETWYILSRMGFFQEGEVFQNLSGTVKDFILTKMLQAEPGTCLRDLIRQKFNLPDYSVILKKFEWLGFFDDTPLPVTEGAAIDVLTTLMLERMSYNPGERDLIVLHHQFLAEYPGKTTRITSTIIDYGIPHGD